MTAPRVIKKIDFIGSFPTAPPTNGQPEIAFVGRSNVGKSSAINRLLNRKKIARVSSTPGRTQAINIFEINQTYRFVDLPGYGFAKVPIAVRHAWGKMIEGYLVSRSALKLCVILVDGRHTAQNLDLQMLETLVSNGIPGVVVATKVDCLKRSQRDRQLKKLREGLGLDSEVFVPFSSVTKYGLDEVWDAIEYALDIKG